MPRTKKEKCEGGCKDPVVAHDSDGVPLCRKCWDALAAERMPVIVAPVPPTPALDPRPYLVLRLTVICPQEQMDKVQKDTDEHLAKFGLRSIILPKDFEFMGTVQPGRPVA